MDRGDTNTLESLHPQSYIWENRFSCKFFCNSLDLFTFNDCRAKFLIVKFKKDYCRKKLIRSGINCEIESERTLYNCYIMKERENE